jgi:hypothetical protein
MAGYDFVFTNPLINTGFVVVGARLTRGHWGNPGLAPPLGFYINAPVSAAIPELVYTTGDGTEGYLRLYPTRSGQMTAPSSVPDSETLYIGWNIPEHGAPVITLTAPGLYKLTQASSGGPLAFTVIGSSGPDTCLEGYVWREAFAGDHVCVLPATRKQAASDNEKAASRVNPQGGFGSKSCIAGYVWREARPGDDVCVTEATRQQVKDDNAAAQSRRL